MNKPQRVKEAQLQADHEALSAMGKKGGEQAAFNRDLRKRHQMRVLQEVALEKARVETVTPEGDVLPPDPNVITSLEKALEE